MTNRSGYTSATSATSAVRKAARCNGNLRRIAPNVTAEDGRFAKKIMPGAGRSKKKAEKSVGKLYEKKMFTYKKKLAFQNT